MPPPQTETEFQELLGRAVAAGRGSAAIEQLWGVLVSSEEGWSRERRAPKHHGRSAAAPGGGWCYYPPGVTEENGYECKDMSRSDGKTAFYISMAVVIQHLVQAGWHGYRASEPEAAAEELAAAAVQRRPARARQQPDPGGSGPGAARAAAAGGGGGASKKQLKTVMGKLHEGKHYTVAADGKLSCSSCDKLYKDIGVLRGHYARGCDGGAWKRWRCDWCKVGHEECRGKAPGPNGPSTLCR
jgi:hypothetical protein